MKDNQKITAAKLYDMLVNEYNIVGQIGSINFKINDLSVKIESKDSVGNLIQEWLTAWLRKQNIEFQQAENSQVFPDFHLDINDKTKGLLEVKVFDTKKGAGFDLANFDSYCKSLETEAYRLDADYLIIGYSMLKSEIKITNVWLKKIWEIAGPSGPYPLKVQEKKKIIYNIRPISWYSSKNTFKPFNSLSEFLQALNDTRYQYPQTRADNAHWIKKVLKSYEASTGIKLEVK